MTLLLVVGWKDVPLPGAQVKIILQAGNILGCDTLDDKPQRPQGQKEVFVSHRWHRSVQPRQVTNVKKLGAVYNVTSDEADGQAGIAGSHKRKLDKSPVEETAPEKFQDAVLHKVWRK